jgi:hypothetical protein
MTATFPLPASVTSTDPARLKMKDVTKADKTVVCAVRALDQSGDKPGVKPGSGSDRPNVTIACPSDGLDAGDEVQFVEVDDIEMDAGSGSTTGSGAVGSAAGAGSQAAAAPRRNITPLHAQMVPEGSAASPPANP